jgi:hypothetical protein
MEHHHSFPLARYASFPLKKLSRRILILLRRLQSSLTSHQSQHHSHRNLLQTRHPPQSTKPHLLTSLIPFGRQFPDPSLPITTRVTEFDSPQPNPHTTHYYCYHSTFQY